MRTDEEYDGWFRKQVQQALDNDEWIDDAEVEAEFAKRHAELEAERGKHRTAFKRLVQFVKGLPVRHSGFWMRDELYKSDRHD